jgi:FkbM family methyltransferase
MEAMGLSSIIQRVSHMASGTLNDFLWKRLRPTTVSPSGLSITLSSLSDWDIFSEIWVSGEYDEPILRVLNAARPSEPVRILDLGANVGLFALRCMELASLKDPRPSLDIVAAEGVPRIFRILTRNLAEKRSNVSLSLHQGLIGERSGIARVYDQTYACSNTVVPTHGKTSALPFRGAHAVRSEYLDLESVLPTSVPIDLLKCDIEGSESAFLRNYPDILARTRLMVIEFHPFHCDLVECRRSLAASGFEREKVLRETPHIILETHVNGKAEHYAAR